MAAGRCHFQTMDKLTLQAPAKLNLLLDITGKRPDGYHEVRMIMQTVRWHDVLTLEKTGLPGIFFRVTDPEGRTMRTEGTLTLETAVKAPTDRETVLGQLQKTGNTPFELADCRFEMEDGLMIPMKEVKQVRRQALEKLENERENG